MSNERHFCQLSFDYPAIKQLALSRLRTAVDNYFVPSPSAQVYAISASYRAKDYGQIVYVSNVAFIFSKRFNFPPLGIAQDFATFYTQVEVRQQDFTITAVPPGFLQLKPTDRQLADWLQCLPFLSLTLANLPLPEYSSPLRNKSGLFAIQYAYSRCYSLLRLAQREGLITLEEVSAQKIKSMFPDLINSFFECSILVVNQEQPFPWLNYRQQLQFCHRAEYALITQLVRVVDDLCCCRQLNLDYWAKIALNLSQAFADFYSHCRIFGETNAQSPKLAQARLGLILATYAVLKLLLQRLGFFQPHEL